MKIRLNIGTKNPSETLATLLVTGFTITHFRQVQGEWEGIPETTLAVETWLGLPGGAESIAAARVLVARLASELGEQSIAIKWESGEGELIPPVYPFDASLFHAPDDTSRPAQGGQGIGRTNL